jgi:hypothetical protein
MAAMRACTLPAGVAFPPLDVEVEGWMRSLRATRPTSSLP